MQVPQIQNGLNINEERKRMKFHMVAVLWQISARPRLLETLNLNLRDLCIERKVIHDVMVCL